ncbi:pseudouridine synthase [Candidatus Weimeria sp. HCP3S3_B5]|uniref:pseudouridine synthase n=1 Tax=Candidatus Weimeria sp. HCP3S3_B5 TaxID=3438871 RepID=UPI002A9F251A|nr:pseudouridine synthase [Lachnospiraceae bacterium]MDY6352166.1 pseudouridine synthase [Lachnospiraceae bacterium]
MEEIRINKYLSECGYCSRRAADKLVEEGRVTADSRTLTTGDKVTESMDVRVDGKSVKLETRRVVIAFNKPAGIVCTSDKKEPDNIIDAISYPIRIYTVGRLDKESRGLIFLTNDGDFMNQMTAARYHHDKEYYVTVDKEVTDDFIKRMAGGVYLPELRQRTRRCQVRKIRYDSFAITLNQGMNRQIRRMCEALGYRVNDLQRIRISGLNLKALNLREGEYRELTDEEMKKLEIR